MSVVSIEREFSSGTHILAEEIQHRIMAEVMAACKAWGGEMPCRRVLDGVRLTLYRRDGTKREAML